MQIFDSVNLKMETIRCASCEAGEFFFRCSFQADTDIEILEPGQVSCVRIIMSNRDSVGLKDEKEIGRDEFGNAEEVLPR